MDSATEFLFANDVHSLDAGIPYPHYSPLAVSSAAYDHPANKFSRAFDSAQRLTALRSRKGVNWPLAEFWKDKVKAQMAVIDSFIAPILSEAVERRKAMGITKAQEFSSDREVKEDESLLDHLINYTAGRSARLFQSSSRLTNVSKTKQFSVMKRSTSFWLVEIL